MPRRINQFARFSSFVILILAATAAHAQQDNIGVPFGQLNNGFFERSGVGFSFGGPNFFFRQNSFDLAIPQFGGYVPDAGATFGFGVPVGNGQASFNFAFGQGSQSSMSSSAVSTTVGNGGLGTFSAGSWTPFVVGAVPVVGAAPFGPAGSPSLLAERLSRLPHEGQQASSSSGAAAESARKVDPSLDPFQQNLAAAQATASGTAGLSVARIEQLRTAQREAARQSAEAEIDRLVAKGEAALEAGKPRVARIYFKQAAGRAEGDLKQQLLKRIDGLPE